MPTARPSIIASSPTVEENPRALPSAVIVARLSIPGRDAESSGASEELTAPRNTAARTATHTSTTVRRLRKAQWATRCRKVAMKGRLQF
ncbi:hypothetical protein RKD44_007669 [Streptomyces collinus]